LLTRGSAHAREIPPEDLVFQSDLTLHNNVPARTVVRIAAEIERVVDAEFNVGCQFIM
jgi:hypothetical protein